MEILIGDYFIKKYWLDGVYEEGFNKEYIKPVNFNHIESSSEAAKTTDKSILCHGKVLF